MSITAPQRHKKTVSEVRRVSVDMSALLDSGEALSGTPTVVELVTSDLTLGSKVVTSGAVTINGVSVPAGEAVQFTVEGGTADEEYSIRITCGTDASQTVIARVRLDVVAD